MWFSYSKYKWVGGWRNQRNKPALQLSYLPSHWLCHTNSMDGKLNWTQAGRTFIYCLHQPSLVVLGGGEEWTSTSFYPIVGYYHGLNLSAWLAEIAPRGCRKMNGFQSDNIPWNYHWSYIHGPVVGHYIQTDEWLDQGGMVQHLLVTVVEFQ